MGKYNTIAIVMVILSSIAMAILFSTDTERVITVEDINSTAIHYGKDNDAHFYVIYNNKQVMEEMDFSTYLKLNAILKTNNKGVLVLRRRSRFYKFNHIHMVTEDVENLYH